MLSNHNHVPSTDKNVGLPTFESHVHIEFEAPAFFQFVLTESLNGAIEMHCKESSLNSIAAELLEKVAVIGIESAKFELRCLHFDGGISGFETSTQDLIEFSGKPLAVGIGFLINNDLIVAPAKETVRNAVEDGRWKKFKHLVPIDIENYTLEVPALELCVSRAGYKLHIENRF